MNHFSKAFIIAEAGVNHNGDIDIAKSLIDTAKDAGADAVKFQTFKADALVTQDTPKAQYQAKNTGTDDGQYDMLKRLELSDSQHLELAEYCKEKAIAFMSTAFDVDSLSFLEQFDQPFIKIPSGEIRNALLLWHSVKVGKPLIISTGMATLGDIEFALNFVNFALHHETPPSTMECITRFRAECLSGQATIDSDRSLSNLVTLLHCTSEYPTPLQQVNLRAMQQLSSTFGVNVGYSDHTLSLSVPVAAVSLGATCIEKHFTLSREMDGPDHRSSLEPEELKLMVSMIRDCEGSLGHATKFPQPNEFDTQKIARQKLVAKKQIKTGERLTEDNVTTARSPNGICASHYWSVLGQKSSCDVEIMSPICISQ